MLRLLDSEAYALFSTGRRSDLAFAKACTFWGARDKGGYREVAGQQAAVGELLGEVSRVASQGEIICHNGRVVTGAEVTDLMLLHVHLGERFARHLQVLESHAVRKETVP